jgi:hypothetical protein
MQPHAALAEPLSGEISTEGTPDRALTGELVVWIRVAAGAPAHAAVTLRRDGDDLLTAASQAHDELRLLVGLDAKLGGFTTPTRHLWEPPYGQMEERLTDVRSDSCWSPPDRPTMAALTAFVARPGPVVASSAYAGLSTVCRCPCGDHQS